MLKRAQESLTVLGEYVELLLQNLESTGWQIYISYNFKVRKAMLFERKIVKNDLTFCFIFAGAAGSLGEDWKF